MKQCKVCQCELIESNSNKRSGKFCVPCYKENRLKRDRERKEEINILQKRRRDNLSKEQIEERNIKRKEYRKENHEVLESKRKKYIEENSNRIKEVKRHHYFNNREYYANKSKKYRENNQESVKDYQVSYKKKYYSDNQERLKREVKEYRKANRGKVNYWNSMRDKRVKCATPPWLTKEDKDQMKSIYVEATRLSQETGISHHVDHCHPINHKDSCGLHVPWNLQILTAKENITKNNKSLD